MKPLMQQSIATLAVERPESTALKTVESSFIRPFWILWVIENRDHHPTFRGTCEVSDEDTHRVL